MCSRETVTETCDLSDDLSNWDLTTDLPRIPPETKMELLDIGPDLQPDPDKMNQQACSQPGMILVNNLSVNPLPRNTGYIPVYVESGPHFDILVVVISMFNFQVYDLDRVHPKR